MQEIFAVNAWPSNAELIEDVAKLGYLHEDWLTLDATYGKGQFWKLWKPKRLVTCDKFKGDPMLRADFRRLPFRDGAFGAVMFDPPYKLNGTPTETIDDRYGVEVPATRKARLDLILDGLEEQIRVCGGMLLVKCQNQVNGGKVRWQTDMVTEVCYANGFEKVDEFMKLGYRKQPEGRSQVHARRNYSSLLVFSR